MRLTKLRSFCVGARTTHARVLVSLRLYAGKKKKRDGENDSLATPSRNKIKQREPRNFYVCGACHDP